MNIVVKGAAQGRAKGAEDPQRIASDPARSVFVAANAGSGKTHVLTERVVRLLLSGAEPSRILCLTYTKAAAAEMQTRVFSRLAAWTTMDEAELGRALEALEQRRPSLERIAAFTETKTVWHTKSLV